MMEYRRRKTRVERREKKSFIIGSGDPLEGLQIRSDIFWSVPEFPA